MAYTLSQLVTDVRGKLDDTNFSSTLIKDFINDTQRYIVNKHHFKFMEGTYTQATSTDDYLYDLGADVEVVESIRITAPSGDEIDITPNYLTYAEFDNRFPDPSEDDSGIPRYWTIREDELNLYPKPDGAYTLSIRYQKKPTTLSSDSDVPEVPERFKELLVLGALVRAHKYNDNYDIAQAEQATLDELLLDAVSKTYTRQNRPTIMRVNGRRG